MANGTPENVVIEIGKDAGTTTISTSVQTGTVTTSVYNGCVASASGENIAYPILPFHNTSSQTPSWIFYAIIRIPGATSGILSGSYMLGLSQAQLNPTQGYNTGTFTTYGELGGVQDCNWNMLDLNAGGIPTGSSSTIEIDMSGDVDHKIIRYRPSIYEANSGVIDYTSSPINPAFKGGPGATRVLPWEKFSFDSPSYALVNAWFPKGSWTSAVNHKSQQKGMSFDGLSIYFIHAESWDYDGRVQGHVFDCISGINNDLFLLGNGTDASSLLNVGPLQDGVSGSYYMYASPFQHGPNWSEIRQTANTLVFKGLMGNQMFCNSYYGAKTNTLSGKPWRINPCYDFLDNYIGMRNYDFLKDHENWHFEFTVTTITPGLELRVMQGQPNTYTPTTPFPSIALKITDPGTYSVCIPALLMQFEGDPEWNEIQGGEMTTNHGLIAPVPNGAILFDVQLTQGTVDYYNKEIVINGLDIRKSTPDITTVVTPTYTQGLDYDINVYDWDRLDVMNSESVPLSLNYSIADLRDLKKKSVGFSKTFIIPANQHNEMILGSMLGVGSERQMIDWMIARIKVDGVVVFKGLFRVEESDTGNGGSYRCHIIQDNITWSGSMGDNTICDLSLLVNEDSNGDPEEKNYTTITNSWTNTPDNSSFFYGLANYGEWNAMAANGSYDHNNSDFHPFIFTKSIVDEIFKQTGYTLNSAFFNTPFFKQLCHPYTSGEDYSDTSDVLGPGGSNFCHATLTSSNKFSVADADGWNGVRTQTKIWPLIGNPGNNFSSGSGSSNGYQVPFTGMYDIYARAQLEVNTYSGFCGHTDHCYAFLQVTLNGSVIDNFSFTENGTNISTMGGANHVSCIDNGYKLLERGFQILLQAGDIVHIKYRADNYANYCSFKIWVKEQVFDIHPMPSSIIPPAPTDLTRVLPCIKQVDFIQGLTEMFNLQWLADEERKMISVEPYDDFFGSGSTLDWTDKIDTKQWSDRFIIENLAKVTAFTYKLDTNDKGMEFLYEWRAANGYDQLYNAHYEDNGMRFRKEYIEMGTKVFHNTWSFNDYDQSIGAGWGWGDMMWNGPADHNNPIMPVIWAEGGSINGVSRTPYNVNYSSFAMRILNYYGKNYDVSTWQYVDENAISHNKNHYPYSGMVNKYAKRTGNYDPYCITFNDHEHRNTNIVSPGLFTKYWGRAYRMLNGGSALRTCSVYLTANDIANFDYRDLIHIEIDNVSTYWTVNKIIDYNPTVNNLTTVELIEYKDKVVNKTKTRKAIIGGGNDDRARRDKKVMGTDGKRDYKEEYNALLDLKETRDKDACVMYVEEPDGVIHNLVFNEGEEYDNHPLYIKSTKGDDDVRNHKRAGSYTIHTDPPPEEKKS